MSIPSDQPRQAEVIVIGGGISGIGTVIKLREAGVDDVLILEKSDRLGGTWRDNTYPGCACDIPSAVYSFSFEPNPDWSRVFAGREEIQEYVTGVAAKHGVPERTHFGTELLDARWDADRCRWALDTTAGAYESRFLVLAVGPLHEPVLPDVEGLGNFTGHAFHSARWDHDHDLTGERVAVIGTGASAGQFVPLIRRHAEKLVVFQRTPAWVMPKFDWKLSRVERTLLRRVPFLQRIVRWSIWGGLEVMIQTVHRPWLARRFEAIGRWNINRAVKDPELRKALTPDYTLGCKRVLVSNTFYPALAKPNVDVVPAAVTEIRERSIVDANGDEHEVDTIIFGTGFHVHTLPIAKIVRRADGTTLEEVWDGSPRAYLGSSIAGFPNTFMLFGPNIGTASAFAMLEAQLRFVVDAVTATRRERLAAVDVRAEVQHAYNEEVRAALAGSVWNAGGCSSYYLDANGYNASAWPWSMSSIARRLRRFPLEDYDTVPEDATAAPPPVTAGAP